MNYSATTPVDSRVVDKTIPYLHESFGNPASRSYLFGRETEKAVEIMREQVITLVNADPREIVWTSSATGFDNLAIKGAANLYSSEDRHTITVRIEHKAILDTIRELECQGFEVAYLNVKDNGLVDIGTLKQAICPDTIPTSVMMVSDEVGVIRDIKQPGKIYREKGVIFHADIAQVTGKVGINLQKLKVDLISFSTHKTYGPRGIRVLYVRRKPCIHAEAQTHGGDHEHGMHSGTLATHQVVGMGEASRIVKEETVIENECIHMLRDCLYRDSDTMEEVYVNGNMEAHVPRNLNISFSSMENKSLIMAIKDVAVPSGSTCMSASPKPSYVLRALGRNSELVHSLIRFTVDRLTTEEEVDHVIGLLKSKIGKLRDLSPLWEMYKDSMNPNSVQWATH